MAYGQLVLIQNELSTAHGYLQHEGNASYLVPVVVKGFLTDLVAVADALDVIIDAGANASWIRDCYEDEFKKWKKFRNDASHQVERYFRAGGTGNNPDFGRGRRVTVYEPGSGIVATGTAELAIGLALYDVRDILALVERMIFKEVHFDASSIPHGNIFHNPEVIKSAFEGML